MSILAVSLVQAQTTQLIVNPHFTDSSKWTLWKNDWEDTEPTFASWYCTMQNSYIEMYVYDEVNWDYGDAGASQGRREHGSGSYYNSPLVAEPEIANDLADGKLIGYITMRHYYTPIKRGGFSDPRRGWTACSGMFFMVFVDVYVYDKRDGQYKWMNYDDPNRWGEWNFVVLEMSNRWAYDWGAFHQVDGNDFRYNFMAQGTTHDSDWHYIKAGWIFSNPNTWETFGVDFGKMWREWAQTMNDNYYMDKQPYYVVKGKIRAVALSLECYLAEWKGAIDQAYLYLNT